MRVTVYGEGGFNPKKKNDNVVETYEVEDSPVDAVESTLEDRIAALEEAVNP